MSKSCEICNDTDNYCGECYTCFTCLDNERIQQNEEISRLKAENEEYKWHNEDLNLQMELTRPKDDDDRDADDKLIDNLLAENKRLKQLVIDMQDEFEEAHDLVYAENKRLREALKPFSEVAAMLIKLKSTGITLWSTNNNYLGNVKITAEMVINAGAALEGK